MAFRDDISAPIRLIELAARAEQQKSQKKKDARRALFHKTVLYFIEELIVNI